ncbi:transcription coactivator isoform X2 [Wolffia australiana]
MAAMIGTFHGTNVFLSRNLVPPEMFDALHDALRLNGARVFLCCDPSRNEANDYHVISSQDHEKFADLRAKGCNLLGPHCVLSCAKERRVLPKQAYTCCLAMDGVRVLASGFDKEEKVKIEQLVTAMGGILVQKAALDVSFVIARNVLAAKYKWAMHILKKPLVSLSWLHQCWAEHRVVPHDPYRILPFSGLTICVTGIPADEREKMKTLITQNGGKYSADLTKKCTHLISDAPEGDKYMVARKWGNIFLVNRKWFHQSITGKACLDENHYPVSRAPIPPIKPRSIMRDQASQDQSIRMSESAMSACFSDFDAATSQIASSNPSDSNKFRTEDGDLVANSTGDGQKFPCSVAKDSEDEDNDLYLSDCRILVIGFEGKDQRKLVKMIRNGGGTRHMLLTEKLTHIIVGAPSETEKKEVRHLAAYGVINVVKAVWLEDCEAMKKEVPVSQRHSACDLLLPREAAFSYKVSTSSVAPETNNVKNMNSVSRVGSSMAHFGNCSKEGYPSAKALLRDASEVSVMEENTSGSKKRSGLKSEPNCGRSAETWHSRLQSNSNASGTPKRTQNVFDGLRFCFSDSFPKDKRAEIEEWIAEGGGLLVARPENAKYVIQSHGASRLSSYHHAVHSLKTTVSSHWIRFCLQEKCLLDIGSHVLFSPLPCQIPLAGFEEIRFCVSQYEDKERLLLRNLCFTLGAKFTEKLTKKVTHLICKFTSGPKYEAACTWGIQLVTAEWISECIKQNMRVPMDGFCPRAALDSDAGLCITSQYPTQAVRMIAGDVSSQPSKESKITKPLFNGRSQSKRQRHSELDIGQDPRYQPDAIESNRACSNSSADVADAIEDLLAQSDKGTKMALEEESCIGGTYSPGNFIIGRDPPDPGLSFPVPDRTVRRFDDEMPRREDAFSETQTESQVVWYEEDLSGRQRIIERVRSQSMGLTPEPK